MIDDKIEQEWSTIIKARNSLFDVNLKDIFKYRDLVFLLIKRDFVTTYQQALLGPLWFVLQPLLTTIVFTVVFGQIARIPTDGIPQPLFYLSGLTVWNYFSNCLISNSNVFVTNAGIFGKVYFPRLVVPLSIIISTFVKFIIQFLLFIVFYVFFIISGSNIHMNLYILLVPLLLIQSAILGLGCGIIISSLTTKYRDLGFLVGFGIQLWMYATPIVYPSSQIPAKWSWVMAVNPIAPIVEFFRFAFLGTGTPNFFYLGVSGIITVVLLFFGILLFNKVEKSFMDRV